MDKLLTIDQAADILQVKRSTIYAWVHQSIIPHIKMGKLVRFRQKTLEQWLDKKETRGRLTRKIALSL